jgi:hypothetical protein
MLAYAAIDASGALDKIELQTAITRMTQAGVKKTHLCDGSTFSSFLNRFRYRIMSARVNSLNFFESETRDKVTNVLRMDSLY